MRDLNRPRGGGLALSVDSGLNVRLENARAEFHFAGSPKVQQLAPLKTDLHSPLNGVPELVSPFHGSGPKPNAPTLPAVPSRNRSFNSASNGLSVSVDSPLVLQPGGRGKFSHQPSLSNQAPRTPKPILAPLNMEEERVAASRRAASARGKPELDRHLAGSARHAPDAFPTPARSSPVSNSSVGATFSRTAEVVVRGGFDPLPPYAGRKGVKKECQDVGKIIRNFANRPNWTFVGVFDGHGQAGGKASKLVSERLPAYLAENVGEIEKNPEQAFSTACRRAHADLCSGGEEFSFSGTTAVFVLASDDRIYVGHVGDSRAVLAKEDGRGGVLAVDLTVDHKPNDPKESHRISHSGGRVDRITTASGSKIGPFRVYAKDKPFPGLAMSRSLGDVFAHSVGVSMVPDVTVLALDGTEVFVLLASDGLWEYFSNKQAVDFVWERLNKPASTPPSRLSREAKVKPSITPAEQLADAGQMRWVDEDDGSVVDDTTVAVACFKALGA